MIEVGLYFYFYIVVAFMGMSLGFVLTAIKDWAGF